MRELARAGIEADCNVVNDEATFVEALKHPIDLVIADYHLPRFGALHALELLKQRTNRPPTIVVSGHFGEEAVVAALTMGAADYLFKDRLARIGDAVRRVLDQAALQTEKERIESALRREREEAQDNARRLAAIVESSDDAIFAANLDGTITNWNAGAERLYGHPSVEAVGRPLTLIVPRDRLSEIGSVMQTVRRGERVRSHRTAHLRRNGSLVDVSIAVSPITGAEGQVVGASIIARDNTDLMRLELQLRHSQKLEAVGRLAGGVAHDFNNLLTVIIGYCNELTNRLQMDEKTRSDLEEIERAAEKAAAVTHQLLAFSRRQLLKPVIINANEIVEQTDRMLRRLIGEDIELTAVLEPRLKAIKADPGQLEQVIMNLAVNARDAMPKGGKLTIQTANIVLDEEYVQTHVGSAPGPYVMLAVSDTGVGIDAELQRHIFEPFFTTKQSGKGTGLGLATVYGIVKQSGGHIWVYSEPGHGTTFKIYLPAAKGIARRTEAAHKEIDVSGTETILLVEDDQSVRSLAKRILERAGYTIIEAGDGEQALRILRDGDTSVELLLTDVIMPQMGGRALVESLSRLDRKIRVMYMSGYTDDAIVRHGVLEAGAHFIEKPFVPAELLRRVREVLNETPITK